MKSIYTLIDDIYDHVGGSHGLSDAISSNMAASISSAVQRSLGPAEVRNTLHLSGLGDKCPCALWHSIHRPDLAEPLPPATRIKFAYGHVIEHMVIGLAKACGHTVEGEQDAIVCDGIVGHRDCIIDGAVVDVKSAATRSFLKFRDRIIAEDDPFGYLAQLDGYVLGSVDDPLVSMKDRGFLLAVDKQLGHLALYDHRLRESYIRDRIKSYKECVALDVPPRCTCQTVADGESGNIKLDVPASYNSFKYICFPNLRTFLYEGGPRFLTVVKRLPRRRDGSLIPEVDSKGKMVYANGC